MDSKKIIEQDEDLINLPLECEVCGEEIKRKDGDSTMLKVDESRNPLCENHSDESSEIVTTKRCGGHPHNGLHPETGDPIDTESTSWLRIEDSESL